MTDYVNCWPNGACLPLATNVGIGVLIAIVCCLLGIVIAWLIWRQP